MIQPNNLRPGVRLGHGVILAAAHRVSHLGRGPFRYRHPYTRPTKPRTVVRQRKLLAVVTSLLFAASCGLTGSDDDSAGGSTKSSPFTLGSVPDGFELLTAGSGTQQQIWGDDTSGSQEPFTVLAPAGETATGRDAVVVSVTGFRGYEGGLDQASAGYSSFKGHFKLDGKAAIFVPAGADQAGRHHPADLVVQRGRDLAVRVTTRTAAKERLVDIARRVETSERTRAPDIPNPPTDLHVIGSVDAAVVVALSPAVSSFNATVPGTAESYGVGWVRGSRDSLAIVSIPGKAGDLDALDVLDRFQRIANGESVHTSRVTIDGRSATVLETSGETGTGTHVYRRAIVMHTTKNDLLVVATSGEHVASKATLASIASAVHPMNQPTWDAFVAKATGSVSLSADPGAIELARGHVDGVDWLFQARPASDITNSVGIQFDHPGAIVADPCLKLSNRHRVCANSGGTGGPTGEVIYGPAGGPQLTFGFPTFVIIMTKTSATKIRVQTKTATAMADLHLLPGGNSAAIVFVDRPGLPGCVPVNDPRVPATLDVMYVGVLDASGKQVDCLGLKPASG